MTGVPMPDREYTNQAQLIVTAPDPATAQDALEQAVAAFSDAVTAASLPVRLQTEVEDGLWVLSQA